MAETLDEEALLLKSWRLDAVKFAEECLGINPSNGFTLSNQQRQGLAALSELARCKHVVSSYKRGLLKRKPTDQEYEWAKKSGISIMSGKGTGKDAFASWAILWMLCCWDGPKIMCTAPTQDQLRQVLWSEIAVWHGRRNQKGEPMFLMKDYIAVEGSKIYMKGVAAPGSTEKDGAYWSAFYRTPQRNVDKTQMAKTLSGQHADTMMFVLDEASGIDDAVFGDLENTMTGPVNFALLIFNPHKPVGFAYDTHYGKHKDQWVTLHWDAEESSNVTAEQILRMEEKYGRDSDNFRVNVNGLPPRGGDDALIPYQKVYEAYTNIEIVPHKTDKLVIGIDYASTGSDRTIMCVRKGGKVLGFHAIDGLDDIDQIDNIDKILKTDYAYEEIERLCPDATAIGKSFAQLLDRRYRDTVQVQMLDMSTSARGSDAHRFKNLRNQLWYKLRERFMANELEIPANPFLLEELKCLQFKETNGKIIVDDKVTIKKKIGRSCDYADALMLTCCVDEVNSRDFEAGDRWRRERHMVTDPLSVQIGDNNWLLQ